MSDKPTGIDIIKSFTPQERQHPIFKRFVQAFAEERASMLEQLAHPTNIENTTLLRGELRLLTRISARTSEVGPESRQSEPEWPESASRLSTATGFPVSFEK